MSQTTEQLTYSVPGVSCGHCRSAIVDEVEKVAGVASVDVDLDAKNVTPPNSSVSRRSSLLASAAAVPYIQRVWGAAPHSRPAGRAEGDRANGPGRRTVRA